MRTAFYCPRWGSEHLDWPIFLRKVKAAGYDGVEWGIAADIPETLISEVVHYAHRDGLRVIAQHYDTTTATLPLHLEKYTAWLKKISRFGFEKINSQTGKDHFDPMENKLLIAAAKRIEQASGIPVLHETHRGKFGYAAHVMSTYLEDDPELRITLDLSHWVCVAESWLEDQEDAVRLAISRTSHMHARVGHTEGPQIPDPRVPEWAEAAERHLRWWDAVVAAHRQAGAEKLTITPEFGPSPYMVHLPRSGKPIADQWEVNLYMLNLLKNRYA